MKNMHVSHILSEKINCKLDQLNGYKVMKIEIDEENPHIIDIRKIECIAWYKNAVNAEMFLQTVMHDPEEKEFYGVSFYFIKAHYGKEKPLFKKIRTNFSANEEYVECSVNTL